MGDMLSGMLRSATSCFGVQRSDDSNSSRFRAPEDATASQYQGQEAACSQASIQEANLLELIQEANSQASIQAANSQELIREAYAQELVEEAYSQALIQEAESQELIQEEAASRELAGVVAPPPQVSAPAAPSTLTPAGTPSGSLNDVVVGMLANSFERLGYSSLLDVASMSREEVHQVVSAAFTDGGDGGAWGGLLRGGRLLDSLLPDMAKSGDHTRVQHLLQVGVAPDQRNAEGKTALMLAAQEGHSECVVSAHGTQRVHPALPQVPAVAPFLRGSGAGARPCAKWRERRDPVSEAQPRHLR